ncbi:MAG: glycosyltransferase family 1 protein [Patescibacteria group bacterium]
MRTFIDIRSLDTKQMTGVPEYVRLLTEHILKEAPQDEYVFFANSWGRRLEKTDLLQKERRDWVNFGIPNRLFDISNRLLNFPKIDKLIPADVFYSPHFNILSFENPKKHVLTIHDISFVHYPEFFSPRKKLWHWQQNWQKQIKEAGSIITNAEYTRDDLISTFELDEKKVKRIYAGVDPTYKKIPKNDTELIRFRNEKSLTRPFLLSIGTIEPRKNITATIRAFNILKNSSAFKDLELIIVGSYGWLYDKILKEADCSPYRKSIRFWGRSTPKENHLLYNLASVFVFPSFLEGIGFPPLEAQACGLPVVASDRSSFPEMLGSSALLVDPWKIGELALAIEGIMKDGKLRGELTEKGIRNAARFQWEDAAKDVIKILKENNG